MVYETFHELVRAYLDTLKGRASYAARCRVASQWILTLTSLPIRAQLLERHKAKGHGHFEPGSTQANEELALIRAACRWGIYQERWTGGDPTAGLKKWKRPKRRRTGKFDELKQLLAYLESASTDADVRDRALFGLMLFTGCRPGEARNTHLGAITPYGEMGSWLKGRTKTGENQELPLPTQLMPWIAAWRAIRPNNLSPYLFPGQWAGTPITENSVRRRWDRIRQVLGFTGLWNYDLRRTLTCSLGNELKIDDHTIRAIINHYDGTALSHYYVKSFDSLTGPIQLYADWLFSLKEGTPVNLPHPMPTPVIPIVPIQAIPRPTEPSLPAPPPVSYRFHRPLSGRDRQVLALIAQGLSYKEMAHTLGMSLPTVGSYRYRLLARLRLTTTAELANYAREHEMVQMPEVVIKRGRTFEAEWPG
jgi:integrase/DNA-binding CsgD family transcriptional regulator